MWEIIETEYGYIPYDELYCPHCGERMLLHQFTAIREEEGLSRDLKKEKHIWYHVDIAVKCTSCGLYQTFGVPIDKKTYEKLVKSKLNGLFIKGKLIERISELWRIDSDVVKNRLKTYGYF